MINSGSNFLQDRNGGSKLQFVFKLERFKSFPEKRKRGRADNKFLSPKVRKTDLPSAWASINYFNALKNF